MTTTIASPSAPPTAGAAPASVSPASVSPPLRGQHPQALAALAPFVEAGKIGLMELAVLDASADRFGLLDSPATSLAFALALRAPRAGHLGVMLGRAHGELTAPPASTSDAPPDLLPDRVRAILADLPGGGPDGWLDAVLRHPSVLEVDGRGRPTRQPGFDAPFVWQPVAASTAADGARRGILMTRRMWQQQARLAEAIAERMRSTPDFAVDPTWLKTWLDRLHTPNSEPWQAGWAVATGCLTVITGGPGTGKTWGLKRVLAVLLQAALEAGRTLRVELAAPTGKAAVRMAEAMGEGLDELISQGMDPRVVEGLSGLQPRTLHRLLGTQRDRPQRYGHGHDNRLNADVVIVDEASMVDVVMMRHLVEAMADGSRLVLLGDRDQLVSVEAGTVLADLVRGAFEPDPMSRNPQLSGAIARLTHSYRFEQAAAVACVAEGLQLRETADLAAAVDLLCGRPPTRATWRERLGRDPGETSRTPQRVTWLDARPQAWPRLVSALAAPYLDAEVQNLRHERRRVGGGSGGGGGEGGDNSGDDSGDDSGRDGARVLAPAQPGYVVLLRQALGHPPSRSLLAARHGIPFHRELLDALGRYRILCVHRRGQRGAAGLNEALSVLVRSALQGGGQRPRAVGPHWFGRPLLITENAYEVDLRNGDVGLVVERAGPVGADGRPGRPELAAAFPEGSSGVRYVALARLPSHDTAFAMTVHKSQGSQFERVALVLPAEVGSPILTRELVYTGITRAKWRVMWIGQEAVLREAVARDVQRASGLAELLWG